ncbi:MAG: tRNA preQ1(34) S-adenosylmethionine ribosyltransferase-isomerase QueA [Candidatus Izemoplasmataceae bacterium]
MKLKDFSYKLPEELVAQSPLKNRTDSRLLVVDKTEGTLIDTGFKHLEDYLVKGDVLVLNDTAVLPARLIGKKTDTSAVIEILLLKQESDDSWECLVKKSKKIKVGTKITFGNDDIVAECVEVKEEGLRRFKMHYEGVFYEILDRLGEMPLPPYIHERLVEKERYQTVYRKHKGSAAAPTAGLHFTTDYLTHLQNKGIEIVYVTLHVGLGTFRPVTVEDVKTHKMHEEYYTVTEEAALKINQAKKTNRRVIVVGTTSLRTLETVATQKGVIQAQSGFSDLFIYPGFEFKIVDSLLTNFHLPESTLLMLVSAFSSKTIIFNAYQYAIENKYRFFSFGDAMFLTNLIKKV